MHYSTTFQAPGFGGSFRLDKTPEPRCFPNGCTSELKTDMPGTMKAETEIEAAVFARNIQEIIVVPIESVVP